ncbi:MAG: coproporphyrinogen III oxidase family protein [Chloroflexota bacterium]
MALTYVTRREDRRFLDLHREEGITSPRALQRGSGPPEGNASLYVHIPFCKSLCPYCSFNRYLFREDKARRYFQSLRKELDLYLGEGYTFSNIYFGGGTPTVLMDELLEFIHYLHANLDVREISLETNPADVSPESVRLLKEAGVKRFSIGVQSFDKDLLKSMGRASSHGDKLVERVSLARGMFDTLNIDLLYNLPSQTIDMFRKDVDTFKDLGIEQVTFYPLMPSPRKATALERSFGKVDSSRERAFYEVILKEMYAGGYTASTTWCFSKGHRIIDEYIVEYDDYVGIGSGAVSYVDDVFYVNSFALERYEEYLRGGRFPVIGWRRLSESETMRYYLLTKLFALKLDKDGFKVRFGADIHRKLRKELLFLKLVGTVQEKDGALHLTEKGMHHVSGMMREFFTSLNGLREYCMRHRL